MKYYDLEIVQAKALLILKEFDRICRNNGIYYSLSAGTLLGAIRHKGFIPWDDDIDIMMTRDQYNLFIKVCKNCLPDNLFLQTYKSDIHYLNGFAKLVDTTVPAFIKETEKMDIVHGISIDIFPIDRCPENYYFSLLDIAKLTVCSAAKYSLLAQPCKSVPKRIIRYILSKIVTLTGTYRINEYEENLKTKYNTRNYNASFINYDSKPPYKWRQCDLVPFSIFDNYISVQFEGANFYSIKNYDLYLRCTYGDYMILPPKEEQRPNHNFYYL